MTTPSSLPTNNNSTSRHHIEALHLNDPIAVKEAQLRAKIAKLKAQQRHQKLKEDLSTPIPKSRTGIRFASAFLIVMAIHVAVIGGFYGVTSIRKMRASDKSALAGKAPAYAGVPEAKATPIHSSAPVPMTSPGSQDQNTKKTEAGKSKGLVKTPTAASKQSPSQDKEPSPDIRALFARRHGQKQALAASASSKTQDLSSQEHATAPEASTERIHKVTPNETLAQIAKSHGIRTADLRKANRLDDSDDLKVGQKLTIPKAETHTPLQLADKPLEETQPMKEAPEVFTPKLERIAPNGVYTVQRGDNAYMVAHRLGVSFTDLMTANSISNPADVTIGMKLKVPNRTLASN